MYEFHYDYMKKKYGNKSRLLFTDIDTLIYEIKIEHVYKDLRKVEEMCDFSSHSASQNIIMIQTIYFLLRRNKKQVVLLWNIFLN